MAERSSELSFVAKVYVIVIVAASLATMGLYVVNPGLGWPDPSISPIEIGIAAFIFGAGALYAEMHPIEMLNPSLFESGDELVVSSAIYITSLLLFGPLFTMSIAGAAALLSDLLRRKPLFKSLFNAGQCAFTAGLSGLFLLGVDNGPHSFRPFVESLEGVGALALCLAAFYLINSALVAVILSMLGGSSIRDMLYHVARQGVTQYAGMISIGVTAAILWTVTPFSLVLLVLPMLVVYLALKTSNLLRVETRQALVSLAGMVDSRDSYAYQHSQEVARYATLIATKLGLPYEKLELINLAAQLHDIGKIGTPDQILHKPGALTPEERARMEDHPVTGAQVLKYFTLFKAGVELVMYHQEHFDGTGYPRGIAGEKIPLGARIIHVADAFQAMTSDRVYRKALPVQEAVRRLQADSGRQFDPVIVNAMLDVLAELGKIPVRVPASSPQAGRAPLPAMERG